MIRFFSLAPRTTMSDVLIPFLLLSSHRHALAPGVQNWYGIHTGPTASWETVGYLSLQFAVRRTWRMRKKIPTIACPRPPKRPRQYVQPGRTIRTVRHRLYYACVDIENDLPGDFFREETIGKNEDEKLILNQWHALIVEELPCKERSRVRRHASPSILGSRRASSAQDRKDGIKKAEKLVTVLA
jgi:hypothetical protein